MACVCVCVCVTQILARTRELSEAREALNQSRQRIDRKAELQQKVGHAKHSPVLNTSM